MQNLCYTAVVLARIELTWIFPKEIQENFPKTLDIFPKNGKTEYRNNKSFISECFNGVSSRALVNAETEVRVTPEGTRLN